MLRLFLSFLILAGLQAQAKADCSEELKGILKRVLNSGPFHVDGKMSAKSHDSVLSADMNPPDAMHTRITTGNKTVEMMKIGPKFWTNDGKAWHQMPEAYGAMAGKMTTSLEDIAPDYVQGAQCLGEKTVDGQTYLAYSFKLDMQGGLFSAQGMLYVDPKTNLLARQIIDGEIFGIKNHTEKQFTFDPSIKIEPPPK
ncbi:hypothetical protein [Methyloferula stellata]|uniref:hypothetical protein n=1 Tax=Methyloferula stellata TaxID=876270 RepID=UPI00036C9EBB|nr:hypothetical protein [Methyloferula stellata]